MMLDWVFYTKVVAAILTLVVLYLVWKELKKAIKDDKDGKTSGKCELD
jgi:F0F1-type ATP synthase membrane subunit b/b'